MHGTLRNAWVTWLRMMRWDFFATASFRYPVEADRALETVVQWLVAVPEAYAAVGVQRGPIGGRIHVHAVIGGTGRNPTRESLGIPR